MEIKRLIVGPLLTNCYLLKSGDETAVIDPGGDARHIVEELKQFCPGTERGRRWPKYIINTHYHIDHVLADQSVKAATGAAILISEKEKSFVEFAADRWLNEGDEIVIGSEKLKVIGTPGHTNGSISLLGDSYIFTGDTIFADGFGRTDLDGGSQPDLIRSLQKLADLIRPGMAVYPGHGQIYTA